jgi:hypothetical protein
MDKRFHIVPSKEIADSQLYKFYKILGTTISKVSELDDNTWFYILPSDSRLDKIKKGTTQIKLLSLVTEYTLSNTLPSNILPEVRYVLLYHSKEVYKDITETNLDTDLTTKLKKKVTFDSKGWATKVEYYESVDVTIDSITGLQEKTYTNLVVEKVKTYTLDANKNLLNRSLSIGYMDNRGAIDVLVNKTKDYTEFDEMIDAQKKRRVNVIDAILVPFVLNKFKELSITTNFTESDTNLKLFASDLATELSAFKNYSDYDGLITGVTNLTYTWLDTDDGGVTFKQRIIDKINDSKL